MLLSKEPTHCLQGCNSQSPSPARHKIDPNTVSGADSLLSVSSCLLASCRHTPAALPAAESGGSQGLAGCFLPLMISIPRPSTLAPPPGTSHKGVNRGSKGVRRKLLCTFPSILYLGIGTRIDHRSGACMCLKQATRSFPLEISDDKPGSSILLHLTLTTAVCNTTVTSDGLIRATSTGHTKLPNVIRGARSTPSHSFTGPKQLISSDLSTACLTPETTIITCPWTPRPSSPATTSCPCRSTPSCRCPTHQRSWQ